MDCQKQSNGNASWGVLYTVLIGFERFCRSMSCWNIYIYIIRGAFDVARFDNPGNAKALTRGTSDRLAPRFLFVYINVWRIETFHEEARWSNYTMLWQKKEVVYSL